MPFNAIRPQGSAPVTGWANRERKAEALDDARRLEGTTSTEQGIFVPPTHFQQALESRIPINHAMEVGRREAADHGDLFGRLAGLASWASQGAVQRGAMGTKDPAEQLFQKAMAIARRMGVKPQDLEDAGQVGTEANLKPGAVGQNSNVVSRRAIQNDLRNQMPKGDRSSADYKSIQKAVSDYEQLKGRAAGSEDDFAIYHLFRNSLNPEERAAWTPSRFLDVKNSAPRAGSLSLDDVLGSARGGESQFHDLIAGKGEPSPEMWADFSSRFGKLTPAQQANFQKYIEGAEIAPSSKARLLGKLGDQPTSQTYKKVAPISGGSGPVGGDDATAGFPASDFRVELGRQPRQMFGQEKASITPGLTRFSQDYNPQLTASSVWKDTNEARPGFGALLGDEQYSLGAGRVAADWDKLREVFSNLGPLQGRN